MTTHLEASQAHTKAADLSEGEETYGSREAEKASDYAYELTEKLNPRGDMWNDDFLKWCPHEIHQHFAYLHLEAEGN